MTAHGFIGSPCTSRRAGAFTFGHWLARGISPVEPHGHAEAHFMYVPSSDYVTRAAGERARDGSSFVYNPPGTWHADHMAAPGMFFSIAIGDALDLSEHPLPAEPILLSDAAQHAIVRRLVRACIEDAADTHTEALGLELIAAAATPHANERRPPRWLARVACMIETRLAEDLTVIAIAREAGVHPVHAARTFRAFYGCTPAEYLRSRRCRRAAYLLSATRRPLAEVALMSGFADQSHFTRHFRRAMGTTPAAYRRLTAH